MTAEHLKLLLDSPADMHLFFRAAEMLDRGEVPDGVASIIRRGRMTALQKPGGGVRGIVAGDIVRRLVARTISQQIGSVVESATAPFQYALSTRAGCECVAHALQALSEVDERTTIMSMDGTSAYDLISRRAMLAGLAHIEGGREVLPFVKLFFGAPSQCWWEDDEGVVHQIHQGEGGEQGDVMMPLLFSLGQHNALHAVQERLLPNERIFAFLDDVYVVCLPDRVVAIHMLLENALWVHARIRSGCGQKREDLQPRRGEARSSVGPRLECGEEAPTFQRLNAASRSSGPHWGIQFSSNINWHE